MNTLLYIATKTDDNLITIVLGACGSLVGAIVYLYISNKKEVKEKDDKLDNHIRETNKDFLRIIENGTQERTEIKMTLEKNNDILSQVNEKLRNGN